MQRLRRWCIRHLRRYVLLRQQWCILFMDPLPRPFIWASAVGAMAIIAADGAGTGTAITGTAITGMAITGVAGIGKADEDLS